MCRAQSFRARGVPQNLGLTPRDLGRGNTADFRLFTAEFDVFHSNNYIFTENYFKVALLQVCL